MKILNVILSVFVLLLAIVSAVFSFFLFEKREQFVNGWSKMAAAINQTSIELDRGSGTQVQKDLTAETIGHGKYAELDANLKKLVEQAKSVIAERDKLAVSLVRIAGSMEMPKPPTAAKLTDLKTGEAQAKAVAARAAEFRSSRDRVNARLASSVRKLNVVINPLLLKNPASAENEFRKLDTRVNFLAGQLGRFKSNIVAIGNTVGERNPNLSDSVYAASLAKVLKAAQRQRSELASTANQLRQKTREVTNLRTTVQAREGQIAGLNRTVTTKNSEIGRLNRIITGSDARPPSPWTDGSPEARRAVLGKVIDVDNTFGFLVVDIGRNTQVEQKIGNKVNRVQPNVPIGVMMTVARGLEGGGEFVGNVKIGKVDDHCAIAEVQQGAKPVKVGDVVYFSADQLKALEALEAQSKKK